MESDDDFKKRANRIGWMIDDWWGLAERGGLQVNEDDELPALAKRLRELEDNVARHSSEELRVQLDEIESIVRPVYDAMVATRQTTRAALI